MQGKKSETGIYIFCWMLQCFFFPKDSYLGALRLFLRVQAAASASPLIFVAGWAMSGESRSAEILGAHKILTELLCPSRNSLAPTRPRFDFIYTEMAALRKIEFYLHLLA